MMMSRECARFYRRALPLVLLVVLLGCARQPAPTRVAPSPTPQNTPRLSPTLRPPTPTAALEALPEPTASPSALPPTPAAALPVLVPGQPGENNVAVGQSFIIAGRDDRWFLLSYDPTLLTLLSGTEARLLGDTNGWQLTARAAGQTVVVLQRAAAPCPAEPCPPEALLQESIPITITD